MEANYNTAGALDKTAIEAASTKKTLDLKKLRCTPSFRSFPHSRADKAIPRNRKSKKGKGGVASQNVIQVGRARGASLFSIQFAQVSVFFFLSCMGWKEG